MHAWLLEFMKRVDEAWPQPGFKHHAALMWCRYGSDEAGWEDKLALQVNIGELWQAFFLTPEDFEKTPEVLVAEIAELLKQPNPLNLQTSREIGTFRR